MSSTPREDGPRILHLRPEPGYNAATDKMDSDLAAGSMTVEAVPDVYLGLARIGRSPVGSYHAVIVHVDALGDEEMEFFPLAARLRRSLDVFVYGDDRARARMTKACELGAAGIATPELIRRLAIRTEPTPVVPMGIGMNPTPARSPVAPPNASETESVPRPPAPEIAEPGYVASIRAAAEAPPATDDGPDPVDLLNEEVDTDDPDEDGTDHSDSSDDEPSSVRVPWLRYGNEPPRRAPRDGVPSPAEPPHGDRPRGRAFLHEPLLTDEELRALLGDAMPDAGALDSDDPAHEHEDDRP